MAKASTLFICQSCGAVHNKWSGRCEDCGEWNTITEEKQEATLPGVKSKPRKSSKIEYSDLSGEVLETSRSLTGIEELDRVLGGGIVKGSATLISGDPGIGKSTLLLQMVCALAARGQSCVYISGEESVNQIKLRAQRLGLMGSNVTLASETSVTDILHSLKSGEKPDLVIIDSIQTMYLEGIESAPGTVSQVRAAAHELIRCAKRHGISMILVGHVTKDGQIAGPRVLEHMVDTVLYFEGERGYQFRILRTVKNRFGGTDEIGVFEMLDKGLAEVTNPSSLFLGGRDSGISGSAIFAGIEGSRPLLVEIQALVAPTYLAQPRRTVVGWDTGRLAMIIAVLEARCGISFAHNEVYLSVAGGFKISEPAADLAVAAALISALADSPIEGNTIFFGEIGLSGEIRAVSRADARLKEAEKLGFKNAYIPASGSPAKHEISLKSIKHLRELASQLGAYKSARKSAIEEA